MAKPTVGETLVYSQAKTLKVIFDKATGSFKFDVGSGARGALPDVLHEQISKLGEKLFSGEIVNGSPECIEMSNMLLEHFGDVPTRVGGKIGIPSQPLGSIVSNAASGVASTTKSAAKSVLTKNILIAGGIAAAAAIGAGGYVLYKKRKAKKEAEQNK